MNPRTGPGAVGGQGPHGGPAETGCERSADPGILVVIPARYESSRFPGKPLAPLLGKPMIVRVLERVREASLPGDVLVATDDERIREAVVSAGGAACMTASDLPSGTDRVWAAISGISCDIIVNVQGDEPLLEPRVIDDTIRRLLDDSTADLATAAIQLDPTRRSDPNVVKVVWDKFGHALYFSRAPIPWQREVRDGPKSGADGRGEQGDGWYQHVGIYAYRRKALERFVGAEPSALERMERLEQLRALSLGMKIAVRVVESNSQGVDTPEDLERVEQWLRSSSS